MGKEVHVTPIVLFRIDSYTVTVTQNMEERKDRQTELWKDRRRYGRMDWQTDRQRDEQRYGRKDETERWID
jgi:hypothetical protein